MLLIRVADLARLLDAGAFCGAVAALGAVRRSAEQLHQHGVINVVAECAFDGVQVSLVAVRRELDAMVQARRPDRP